MRDFDQNEFPLAYLITFRCYGTWLHGDIRGSMDRRHNDFGTPKIQANTPLEKSDATFLRSPVFRLEVNQRNVVESAIREVCKHRGYHLHGINVRTNHVHSVVTALTNPEHVLTSFKSYATRALRKAQLLTKEGKPWSRHGSTIYLWKERDVAKAMEYVMLEQGQDL